MEVLGWIPAFAGMTQRQLDSYRSAALKKQHFTNISTCLVWIKFTGKPARPQARLLRLPDGGDHAGDEVGLALLLERADDGAANHAAVACDVDFVFLAHGII